MAHYRVGVSIHSSNTGIQQWERNEDILTSDFEVG